MKKLVIKGNGLLPLLLFILWGGSVLAQHHTVLGGFEYNNIYYKANVKGLKMFIDDVPMPDDLKLSLTEQMNQIKKQHNTALTGLIVGSAVGLGLSLASGGVTGMAIAGAVLVGGSYAFYAITKPDEQDYYNFINTFNRRQNKSKIEMGLNLFSSPQQDVGLSLALSF